MSTVRLVSWNVCDAFSRKFGHLERLKPDIAVVQEVRPECLAYAAVADRSLWIGAPGQKGMAIIAYGLWRLSPSPAPDERWFLPAVVSNGEASLHLVAAWVDSLQRDLATPTLRALDLLADFIADPNTIIVGDFNQTTTMDARKPKGRQFVDVLAKLRATGFRSAWHSHKAELHGGESQPTLYWTWSEARKYHIDFAFISRDIAPLDIQLGSYDQYVSARISDHVPLIVDFTLQRA